MYVHMYPFVYIYIYIYVYGYTCIYTFTCIYMYICICINESNECIHFRISHARTQITHVYVWLRCSYIKTSHVQISNHHVYIPVKTAYIWISHIDKCLRHIMESCLRTYIRTYIFTGAVITQRLRAMLGCETATSTARAFDRILQSDSLTLTYDRYS